MRTLTSLLRGVLNGPVKIFCAVFWHIYIFYDAFFRFYRVRYLNILKFGHICYFLGGKNGAILNAQCGPRFVLKFEIIVLHHLPGDKKVKIWLCVFVNNMFEARVFKWKILRTAAELSWVISWKIFIRKIVFDIVTLTTVHGSIYGSWCQVPVPVANFLCVFFLEYEIIWYPYIMKCEIIDLKSIRLLHNFNASILFIRLFSARLLNSVFTSKSDLWNFWKIGRRGHYRILTWNIRETIWLPSYFITTFFVFLKFHFKIL